MSKWDAIVEFLGSLMAMAGFVAFVYAFYKNNQIQKRNIGNETWPTVEGKILKSEMVQQYFFLQQYSYEPRIRYSYSVEGKTYESDSISMRFLSSKSADTVQEVVCEYPEGSPATVYYNPDDPEESVLIPGVSVGTSGVQLFSLVMIFVLGYVTYSFFTERWEVIYSTLF